MAEKRKAGGRPRKHAVKPGDRVHVGFRVTPEMKHQLEMVAEKHGRSISQQTEMLLQRALEEEELSGSGLDFLIRPVTEALHTSLIAATHKYGFVRDWPGHQIFVPEVYADCVLAAIEQLVANGPNYAHRTPKRQKAYADIINAIAEYNGLEVSITDRVGEKERWENQIRSEIERFETLARLRREELAHVEELIERRETAERSGAGKKETDNGNS